MGAVREVWEPDSDSDPPAFRVDAEPEVYWIDESGNRVPPPEHQAAGGPDLLVPIIEGDYTGFAKAGQTVISPRYFWAGPFSEGRAAVIAEGYCTDEALMLCGPMLYYPASARPRDLNVLTFILDSRNGGARFPSCKYAFIKETGEIAGPARYERAMPFREGRAAVRVSGLWGYVDPDIEIVIPPRFRYAQAFSNGLATVQTASGYSYVDRNGRIAIPGPFQSASDFHDGIAIVSTTGGYFYIDKEGRSVIPGPYKSAGRFHEGMAAVTDGHGSYFIDQQGRRAVPGTFAAAGRFFHGRANVWLRNGRSAYIDKSGRIVHEWGKTTDPAGR